MKIFVQRDWLRTFEKAKIEINDVSELTFIELGLEKQLKATKDTVSWMEKRLKEGKTFEEEYYEKRLEEQKDNVKLLENMIDALKIKNQKEWKTKKPTQ